MGDAEVPSGDIYIPREDAPVTEEETPSGPVINFDPDPPGADPNPDFYEKVEPSDDTAGDDDTSGTDDIAADGGSDADPDQ
jgi:hypothetical protein